MIISHCRLIVAHIIVHIVALFVESPATSVDRDEREINPLEGVITTASKPQ